MPGQVLAGGNRIDFLTMANGTSPAVGTTAAFTLTDYILNSDVTKDDTGVPSLKIEQVQDDAAFQTFLETYISSSPTVAEDLTFEDGTKQLGSSGSNSQLVAIVYGGIVSGGSSDGKRKVWIFPCRLKSSAGAYKQEGEKYSRPSLELAGFALQGTLTVVTAAFSSTKLTTPAQQVITTATRYGKPVFV